MTRYSASILSCLLAAFALNAGCESSGGHATDNGHHHAEGKMKCSSCGKEMKPGDCAMKCESCGATKKCGHTKCTCSKCGHECKADRCTPECSACGAKVDCAKMQAGGGSMTCA